MSRREQQLDTPARLRRWLFAAFWIALVAMVYSVFALYASGMEAVMGGMLVLGVAYIIWGFIAPRFVAPVIAEPVRKA